MIAEFDSPAKLTVIEFIASVLAAIFLGIVVGFNAGFNAARKPTEYLASVPHPLHATIEKLMAFVDQELKNLQYTVADQKLSRSLFGLRETIQIAYAKAKGELPE